MAEKVERLGVVRDADYMYYVKDGAVWRVGRKGRDLPNGRPQKIVDGSFQMDTDYIYFVDKDGDVSRARRAEAPSPATAGSAQRSASDRPQADQHLPLPP